MKLPTQLPLGLFPIQDLLVSVRQTLLALSEDFRMPPRNDLIRSTPS